MAITTKQLRDLGFVNAPQCGNTPFPNSLRWRGAPVFWRNGQLFHKSEVISVATIDDVAAFIKSLGIKRKVGIKSL